MLTLLMGVTMKVFEYKLKNTELRVLGYNLSVLAEGKTSILLRGNLDGIDILINGISRGVYTATEKTNIAVINGVDLKVVKKSSDMIVITGEVEHFIPLSITNNSDVSLEPLIIEGDDNPFKNGVNKA